ncbi:NAD-dependent epimerase/dehydratase family protein [Clostridium butyricum]|uniref:NAD-dependent epimerase/dehydratase family protein n=1 Tax=Clostridium butyricum TaxID=1492 RepID=UPI0013688238|nr:NAD(P)-dependent oxidoreductase [Clostridium butyricum]MZI81045.1 NAD-dependent epimerase/dehydratase family protein [Clostridium butyricum]
MRSAIITGANGFIGRNVAKYLADNGVKVYAFVRNKNKSIYLDKNKNINIIECKMEKIDQLNFNESIDTFYHFAWEGVSGEERKDYNIQIKNIKYTCDAIKLAKKLEASKFIFAGSIIEYEYYKCIEKNQSSINNIYGLAKITARNMGKIISDSIGIKFIETTISNVYGPGEYSPRLINMVIRKMLKKEKISLTLCEQLYDFIYIDDAVRAYYLIGQNGESKQNYYIGNNRPRKLKKFILEIRNCIDCTLEIGFGDIPFTGVSLEYNELDTSYLYEGLEFETLTSFGDGVLETIKWVKKHEEFIGS